MKVKLILFVSLHLLINGLRSQELVVFTSEKSENPAVLAFNASLLSMTHKLEQEGISFVIYNIDTCSAAEEVTVLPSIYALDKGGAHWYKGRYNTIDRLISFVNSSQRFDFTSQYHQLDSAFVTTVGGFDKITKLKITETTYQAGFKKGSEGNLRKALLKKIPEQFHASYTPEAQFKIYYLDIYPYVNKEGDWMLSTQIFSQHNCIEPIAYSAQPFVGDLQKASKEVATWYQNEIAKAYTDTIFGDGLALNPSTEKASWGDLGYTFTNNNKKEGAIIFEDFDLVATTEVLDPVRFSFAPPIGNYNGSFSKMTGEARYDGQLFEGKFEVDVPSLDMGEASLNASIFSQLLGDQFSKASFTFKEAITLDNKEHVLIGKMNFLGNSFDQSVTYQLTRQPNGSLFLKAQFKIDIRPFPSLEQPDGASPLNHTVYVSINTTLGDGKNNATTTPKNQEKEATYDLTLSSGSIAFTTTNHNVNGTTEEFVATLKKDGTFYAEVDLNTLLFAKGKIMKNHALGLQGLQVTLFPTASIEGQLLFDYTLQDKQTVYGDAVLKLHDTQKNLKLKFEISKENDAFRVLTTVPIERSDYELNGKKANALEPLIFVNVTLLMKKVP